MFRFPKSPSLAGTIFGWTPAAFAVMLLVSTPPVNADEKKKVAVPAAKAPAKPAATGGKATGTTGTGPTAHTGTGPAARTGTGPAATTPTTPANTGRGFTGNPNARTGTGAAGTPNTQTGGRTGGMNPAVGNGNNSAGGRTGGGWNNGPNANRGGAGSVPRGFSSAPTARGGNVVRGPNGQVRAVQTRNGTMISHGPGNSTHIVANRGGTVIVASGHGREGYVQRGFAHGGHEYVQRSYYVHGVAYNRVYRPYSYHGVYLYGYAPYRYYPVAFYGWAYNPWLTPISYRWGWAGNPWYGYYGSYFTPYPVYASASLWLTDYYIAQTLQQGYQDRVAAGVQAGPNVGQATLTPEVKQAIADEVRNQIALENMAGQATAQNREVDPASDGIPRMMAEVQQGKTHILMVSAALTVPTQGQTCPLTHGDVLQLLGPSQQDQNSADLRVMATKGQDCPQGAVVSVQLQDLQEMQNSLRAGIGQGLEELNNKKGQGGLPMPPASAQAAPVQTAFAAVIPPPDPNVAQEVAQEARQAAVEEKEELGGAAGAPASPGTVAAGQSFEQVRETLGEPTTMVDLGAKKIWVYKTQGLKITFLNGIVTAVE